MAIIRPPADWHWVKVLRAKQAPAYSQSSGIVQISVSYIIGCTSHSIVTGDCKLLVTHYLIGGTTNLLWHISSSKGIEVILIGSRLLIP